MMMMRILALMTDTIGCAIGCSRAGKTLALYERGLPHSLDTSLATLGTDDLNGTVDGNKFFGAHFRVVAHLGEQQRLVAFSFGEAGMDALLTMWEYDEAGRCVHKLRRTLPGAAFGFFHDIAVTEHYYVFLVGPFAMPSAMLCRQKKCSAA